MSLVTSCIEKEKNGVDYSEDEIAYIVKAIQRNEWSPEQIGAWLMAVYFRGLSPANTARLTKEMASSGDVLSWPPDIAAKVVDKHSTGGVGDKISLPLVPILMSFGLYVPMISGRGLGHTGGTIDKLETIKGFRCEFTKEEIESIVRRTGGIICAQTKQIAPVDKVLYATRDVTSTVDSQPLIHSSILCKKIAESLSLLLLDVKFGDGAIFKEEKDAAKLADGMLSICSNLGLECNAFLTKNDSPIGRAIGNSAEVIESINFLAGKETHSSLKRLVFAFAGQILLRKKLVRSIEEAKKQIEAKLKNGAALKCFNRMLVAQGVDEDEAEQLCWRDFAMFSQPNKTISLKSERCGWIRMIGARKVAEVLRDLGAGRHRASDLIDASVGLYLTKHVGEYVEKGSEWCLLSTNRIDVNQSMLQQLQTAIVFADSESDAKQAETLIKQML